LRFDVRLERPGEFATLLAIVIPLVSMADALVATATLTRGADATGFGLAWLVSTTSNLIGATLTTPAALLLASTRPLLKDLKRAAEFFALVAGLLVATLLVPMIK